MNHHRKPTLKDNELDPALSEVSRIVIGCAIEIHKALGPGFDKSVYEKALSVELADHDVDHKLRHTFELKYRDHTVGEHDVSLYVDERFVVQILAVNRELDGFDRDQLRAQLRAAELDLGLIVNFNRRRLRDGLVRVLNPDRIESLRGSGEHDEHDDHHDDDDEYEDDDD
mgnify:CR=1 FL=1